MRGISFTLLFLLFNSFLSNGQTIPCPPNVDFEQGNLGYWQFYTGSCCPINANTLSGAVANRHVLTSGNATDQYGGFPIVAPNGQYSLKLGNNSVGAQAERARYYAHIPAGLNNYSIIFRYAVVFEDPGHQPWQQPRFEVKAFDSATNQIIPCSQFTFVSSSNLPGFSRYNNTNIWYKGWTTASINLSGYGGKTVALDFASGDCHLTAHFGYGYIDLECGLFKINTIACSSSPTTSLSAPPGFDTYEWYDAVLTTQIATGQAISIPTPATTTQYAVILKPFTGFGCPDTLYTTVTVSNVAVNATADTTICQGSSITLASNASSDTIPLTYSWAPATGLSCTNCANPVATPAANTSYVVTVTNPLGCFRKDTVNISLSNPAVSLTKQNVLCNGGTSGSITATPSGGLVPYTYSWNTTPLQTTATATGLAAGSYTVTVTDSIGCVKTATETITQPTALTASASKTDASCYGGSNGTATVVAGGGVGSYSYSWNTTPAKTTASVTGLAAGTYTVTVTDGNGCTTTATVTIGQPAQVVATTSKTDVSCYGGNNGTATAVASGGTAPYTYSWNTTPPKNTATATGLAAGTYTVTVKDSENCTGTATVTIGQPAALTAAATQTAVSCNGGANGTATVTASGGTSPYTYSWNTTPVQTGATATGLAAGSYTATITDAHNCTATVTATVTQPALLAANTTKTDASCHGGSDGTATVNAGGGTAPYAYSWSTTPVQTTATATGLPAGTYTVTVTDNNGCTKTAAATVGEPAVLTAATTKTDASCNGGSNGAATVTAGGGTAPYTYSWNTAPAQTTATATGLAAGTYTVTVTDNNGCTQTASATIGQPAVVTGTIAQTDASCYGGSNGTATVTPAGGTAPYTYSWNITPAQTTAMASGLAAGTYTVTITDNNNCTGTATTTIGQATPVTAAATSIDVSCYSGTNGTAAVTASGGTAPYTYSWNTTPVQTTATATGLAAGTYTVTVTDAYGCTGTATATVGQPAALAATTVKTDVSCNGGTNATATVTASGGTSPYTYSWNTTPAQTTATATALAAGTYTATVTDSQGCTATAQATVGQPAPLTAATTKTDATCFSGNNGTATVIPAGGTGPYTYNWNTSPVQATVTATGLANGIYTVTVTDANGCITTATVTIGQPNQLAATAIKTDVSCFGGTNGTATVTATGGMLPYSYNWSTTPVQSTPLATNLAAGTYTVTVTDGQGCIATASALIGQPWQLVTSITKTDVNCNSGNNGTATAAPVVGGTPPYTYIWSTVPVQTTATATGLGTGSYTVTITDSKNCITTATATIGQPATLTATATKTDVNCFGGTSGTASITPQGGTAPYTYSWNTTPVQTTATATGLAAGTYTATVTDANGCSATAGVAVTEPGLLSATATKTDVDCNGGSNGTATVAATGGTAPYTYNWNTTPVQATVTASGLPAGNYTVTVTDSKGCSIISNALISQPPPLTATATKTDATCNGSNNGTATVTAAGGTTPYTYSWNTSPTQTTSTAGNLLAGTYTATVADAHGCTATANAIIGQPAPLTHTMTKTDASCFGDANGTATVTTGGGTAGYNYTWLLTPVQTGATATGLAAGTYTVAIKDAFNCPDTATVTIGEPALLTAVAGQEDVKCFGGSDGIATVTVSGGNMPYTYVWNTTPVQTGSTATGLPIGKYTVNITDAKGCKTSATTDSLRQPPPLQLTASSKQSCVGAPDGLATAMAAGGTPAYTYMWNTTPAQSGGTATNLYPGSYSVTATDANGCQETALAEVASLPQPVVAASGDATICAGSAAPLSVTGAQQYTWTPSTGLSCSNCKAPVAMPSATTTYSVTGIDSNGCSDTDDVTITVIQRVPVSVGPDIDVCIGDPIQLQAWGGVAYLWSPAAGLNNTLIADPVSGTDTSITYQVVITENECFKDTLHQTVRVHKRPTVELGPDRKGVPGARIELNADTTNTISIAWKPAEGLSCDDCYKPIATLSKTITYTATVSSGVCEASDKIKIVVGCDENVFFIPNTFTPNGDGKNDRFWPIAEGVDMVDRFSVYNRWGELMHSAVNFPPNDPAYGWDGRFKGADLPPDVYVYYLESRCGNGEKIFLKGDISLIR